MEVFDVSESHPESALLSAERALATGELVVVPTETVYGVAARPDVAGSTARLFAAKRRSRVLTLPVLASGLAAAERVAMFDRRARILAERFWPGGMTLVLARTEAATTWDLGHEADTVGVRVPAHPVALALLHRTGPLAVSSANVSGNRHRPTARASGPLSVTPWPSTCAQADVPGLPRPSWISPGRRSGSSGPARSGAPTSGQRSGPEANLHARPRGAAGAAGATLPVCSGSSWCAPGTSAALRWPSASWPTGPVG